MSGKRGQIVLAVDPSIKKTGWAVLSSNGPRVQSYGVYKPKAQHGKDRYSDLRNRAEGMAVCNCADVAIFEKAGPPYSNRSGGWKRHQVYVQAVGAVQSGLIDALGPQNVYGVFPSTWKQTKKKKITIREVNFLFGLDLAEKDHDIADAIMLGVFFIERQKIKATSLPPILECTC